MEKSVSHADRLLIVRAYSKKFDTTYIILDPFNPALEPKFKGKVAIVTGLPYRIKRKVKRLILEAL